MKKSWKVLTLAEIWNGNGNNLGARDIINILLVVGAVVIGVVCGLNGYRIIFPKF